MDLNHTVLDQFLSRILELHKSDLISESKAVAFLAEAFALAANGNPNLNGHMKAALEEVWKKET
jgi:hypothetical protein